MAKRTNKQIILGSGKAYLMEYLGTLPTIAEICIAANLLGYIKGGATLSYTETTYEEKDDLGYVRKIITTDEEAKLKLGLITWNGNTLTKLVDRGTTTTDATTGIRTTKLGGAGNAQGKSWVLCFHHEDAKDGDIWVMIVGRNTAGLSLAWATGAGTSVEPEFTAQPHDDAGTLIEFIEQTDDAPGVTLPSTAALIEGSSTLLTAEITPEVYANSVTWSTSDTTGTVLTIGNSHSSTCQITALHAGTATVTAMIISGGETYSASTTVTVTAASE